MPDRDVSHAVVEMIVNLADRTEQPLSELCAGLPVEERRLRGWVGGLDWDVLVELIERLESRLGRERFQREFAAVPNLDPFGRSVLSRLVSPRALLNFVCRVVGPSMFPMYETAYDEGLESGARVATLHLKLKDGFRGCRAIFEAHAVAMAALPLFIGGAPFPTSSTTTEREGRYTFTLPA